MSASSCGEGNRMETGSTGRGGRIAYGDYLRSGALAGARPTRRSARRWSISQSVAAPAGEMPVVLGAGWSGILLHEAVGHGLEGDFHRKKTSVFTGLMGERVASPGRHRGRRRHASPTGAAR